MASLAGITATHNLMALLSFTLLLIGAANGGAESVNARGKRFPGFPSNDDPAPLRDSCYSNTSNDTLPAAHIKGRGEIWEARQGKYTPQWDCKSSSLGSAFVIGGMWFSQDDNSLYVPVCGWYYVTSQVTFLSNSEQAQQFTHSLKIDRNCNTTSPFSSYSHTTFTMIGPLKRDTSGMSSTVVSDLVKICRGGRIYITIPTSYNSCCPLGNESGTMLIAYLVSKADCYWPPSYHTEPREHNQQTQR